MMNSMYKTHSHVQYLFIKYLTEFHDNNDMCNINQSRTNGPINAHLTIAQV